MAGRRLGLVLLLGAALVGGGCGGSSATPSDFIEVPGIGSTRIDVPRPTSGGPTCTVAIPADQSIGQRVAAFRDLGLFADRPDLSNEDIAQRAEARLDELFGGALPPDDPLIELVVASLDDLSVWWGDLEADVGNGSEAYVTTLEQWAAISHGAFQPEDIDEMWETDEGPVSVTFKLGGEDVELKPDYLEDWLDPMILIPINERIAASGRQFAAFQAFDQGMFLLAPTAEQRRGLEARGWCFFE